MRRYAGPLAAVPLTAVVFKLRLMIYTSVVPALERSLDCLLTMMEAIFSDRSLSFVTYMGGRNSQWWDCACNTIDLCIDNNTLGERSLRKDSKTIVLTSQQ